MANFTEALRRIYHDIVVRRSSVRIVTAEDPEIKCSPIFIIGLYRSGTTLLRYILDSHSRICCSPESYFIVALSQLIYDDRCKTGLKSMGFDEEHVMKRIRKFCLYFFENYATSRGKLRWADKTPGYVDYLDFLLRIFPESQFVIIHRHGLDQAHSYTRGGTLMRETLKGYCRDGEDLRIGAVRYWCEKTEKVIAFYERYPQKCVSVFYEELCRFPEDNLRVVFEFLEEPWESEVMEFYKFDHDIGYEDGRVGATRGFSISHKHYCDWTSDLREQCFEISASLMERLGYEI